jgi:hypothetical protein
MTSLSMKNGSGLDATDVLHNWLGSDCSSAFGRTAATVAAPKVASTGASGTAPQAGPGGVAPLTPAE